MYETTTHTPTDASTPLRTFSTTHTNRSAGSVCYTPDSTGRVYSLKTAELPSTLSLLNPLPSHPNLRILTQLTTSTYRDIKPKIAIEMAPQRSTFRQTLAHLHTSFLLASYHKFHIAAKSSNRGNDIYHQEIASTSRSRAT